MNTDSRKSYDPCKYEFDVSHDSSEGDWTSSQDSADSSRMESGVSDNSWCLDDERAEHRVKVDKKQKLITDYFLKL